MTPNLSPSQKKIVDFFYRDRKRYIPKAHIKRSEMSNCPNLFMEKEHYWCWSWLLCQEVKTADYRKRVSELRLKGYDIRSFHVGKRHGYILVSEPEPQMKIAIGG